MNRAYSNPIKKGMYPDPSIVRVDEDYYMVNSTFEFFPAVVISHSKDLVHWKTIGHAITENDYLDMSNISDSHGIWAPDISYHDGKFYIFAPFRMNGSNKEPGRVLRRQLVLTSDKPEGPYSKPFLIDVDDIDPSHFIDDDGSHYMVTAPGITVTPLSSDCSKKIGDTVQVWAGTGNRAPEGPHILKRNGYYYAILAEGGTGYGHSITVARSTSLYGPYEACPHNPVLIQADPHSPIQRSGHGKLVETQNGDWWVVYLCGRPNNGRFTTIGRETALDPVQWTEDGWFTINNGKGPSLTQHVPNLPAHVYEDKNFDDFNDSKLDFEWMFLRNPNNLNWSLDERENHLRLWTSDGFIEQGNAKNVLLRREKSHYYSVVTKMEYTPIVNGENAGLTCYYNRRSFIKFGIRKKADEVHLELVTNIKNEYNTINSIKLDNKTIYLKIDVNGLDRSFYYSLDNVRFNFFGEVKDCTFLADEGEPGDSKRHTGTMVGLYALNGDVNSREAVDFDFFDYRDK